MRPSLVGLAAVVVPALVLGCSAEAGPSATADDTSDWEGSVATKEYVEATSYLDDPADVDAWYALTHNLKDDFDRVCGDTFCEGDYTNIESLAFQCSVEKSAGTIGTCVWVFAGSYEEITLSTGNIVTHPETWRCKLPIPKGTTIGAFLQAVSVPGEQPIDAILPGTDVSIYDSLTDCL